VKGKHRQANRRRQDHARTAEIERLHREIEVETERAETARRGAAKTHTARARLEREQALASRRLRSHEVSAAQTAARAANGLATITKARQELHAVDRGLSTRAGNRGIRQLAQAGVKHHFAEVHPSANTDYLKVWYRQHVRAELLTTREVSLAGWIPDETPYDVDAMAPYATSTVLDTTPEACWAWALTPWIRPATDTDDAPELRSLLGAHNNSEPTLTGRSFPGPHIPSGAALTVPWRHAPVIGQPTDAIERAYWYHRSAWVQQWQPTARPVPFWLPAEHSVSYPDARPLPDETDIRLPYPLVFAAFASPWRIESHPDQTDAPTVALTLMLYARGASATNSPDQLATVLARLQATGLTQRDQLPTALEVLDACGGTVEGLLLTANVDGKPLDDFAWCVAITHPSGLPLARVAIPATRNRSSWRTQVDNIITGIALSCWHQPAALAPQPGSTISTADGDRTETAQVQPAVRVIDIDATSPGTPSARRNDHRSHARPHLRRGHWRRQRTGRGRTNISWTWIRPTTVNGTSGSTDQVYVLPRVTNKRGRDE
jgi:hypothetical protein